MKFNAMLKVDFPDCAIFQPFPKTDLAIYSIENGYLDKDFSVDDLCSVMDYSPLKSKYKHKFANLQKFFYLGSKYPFLIPVIRILINQKPNKVFSAIGLITYGMRSLVAFRINLKDAIWMGLKTLKTFKKN